MVKNLAANEGDIGDVGSIQERAPGEGSDNPLQCSCLENPVDRRIWRATVHGIAEIQTRLGMQYFLTLLQQSVSQWLSLHRFPGSPHTVKQEGIPQIDPNAEEALVAPQGSLFPLKAQRRPLPVVLCWPRGGQRGAASYPSKVGCPDSPWCGGCFSLTRILSVVSCS